MGENLSATAMLLLALLPQPLLQSQQSLFTIARSTNANVIHYDANFVASGKLDPKTPVVAYWIMLAENGRREELSSLEKRSAYGFTTVSDSSSDCYRMTLAADKNRQIQVCAKSGSARAEMTIDGHRSLLKRMFVSTRRVSLVWKAVNYIELFGTDAENGVQRYEKIIPK